MTQYDLPSPINPLTTSGSTLADVLSGSGKWRDALESLHSGSSRPAYASAGMLWIDDDVATSWKLYVYDGSQDILIATLNLTTGEAESTFAERFGRFNLLRWSAANPQFGTDTVYSTVYDPGAKHLIAVGLGSGAAPGSYSADGISWTAISSGLGGTGAANYASAHAPTLGTQGRTVVAGSYVGSINARYSDDGGVTWTNVASGELNQSTIRGMAWSPDLTLFVAVGTVDGGTGTNSYTSPDGILWNPLSAGLTGTGTLYGVAWGEDRFVIVGSGNAGGFDSFRSTDGVNWSSALSLPGASISYSPKNGRFVAGTFTSGTIQYSTDGVAWTSVTLPSGVTGTILCSAWLSKAAHYIVGSFSGAGLAAISPDGIVWERVQTTLLTGGIAAAAEHDFYERSVIAGAGGELSHTA